MQEGKGGIAPVFCVPGAGASVTSFCDLAEALGSHVSVYGLQPRGMDGKARPFADVSSAARAYLRSVEDTVDGRAYRLVGHSFGGWVVFEMAVQLERMGKSVEMLLVLDSDVPSARDSSGRSSRELTLMRLVELFEQHAGRELGISLADFEQWGCEKGVRVLHERLIRVGLLSVRSNLTSLRGLIDVFETCANTDYVPSIPYDGPLHYISAEQPGKERGAAAEKIVRTQSGWRALAARATFGRSAGNHMTMLRSPYVTAVAKWMTAQFPWVTVHG